MSRVLAVYAGPAAILLLLVLLLTGNLLSLNVLVIAGQLGALALTVSARVAFGSQRFNFTAHPAEGPLLERGPYRWIRHPMYAGAMLFFFATVLGHLSLLTVVVGGLVIVLLLARIQVEENLLAERYPGYEEYARRTKRIIPLIY
jgi:protein-S-isoprenylcysteine O-methyltransferase Ste14